MEPPGRACRCVSEGWAGLTVGALSVGAVVLVPGRTLAGLAPVFGFGGVAGTVSLALTLAAALGPLGPVRPAAVDWEGGGRGRLGLVTSVTQTHTHTSHTHAHTHTHTHTDTPTVLPTVNRA